MWLQGPAAHRSKGHGWLQGISQRNSRNEYVREVGEVVFVLLTSHNYAGKYKPLGHITDEGTGSGTVSNPTRATQAGNGQAGLRWGLPMPLSLPARCRRKCKTGRMWHKRQQGASRSSSSGGSRAHPQNCASGMWGVRVSPRGRVPLSGRLRGGAHRQAQALAPLC